MPDPTTPANPTPTAHKVKFFHQKGSLFRIVHVDGSIGGLTPSLDLFVSVYNQRAPIPQVTVQEISEEGVLGDEILADRQTKEGIVREVEVGLIMNLQTAKVFHQWLTDKIGLAEKAQQQISAEAQQKAERKIQ